MKAIIPVAGAGTMLRPHTHTQPKALIPVAGKPILGHIVEMLHQAGIQDFVFVVGYLGEKIKQYVEDTFQGQFQYQFVVQEPRRGLAHAISLTKDLFEPGEPCLIALGDTIADVDIQQLIDSQENIVCLQEVDDPANFGIVLLDEQQYVRALVEKPRFPKSNLALVGLYKMADTMPLFAAIDYLIEHKVMTNNEFTLTDALQRMVEQGVRIRTAKVRAWFDCGEKDALLSTNRILLNRVSQAPCAPCTRSVIIPPVWIPDSCVIEDSIVGPYVALGEHATVRGSIVQNSILGTYSRLESVVMHNSIVGNDTTLRGRWQSINIGDNTEIDFNQQ